MAEATVTIYLRVPPELFAALNERANKEASALNPLLVAALKEYVVREEMK